MTKYHYNVEDHALIEHLFFQKTKYERDNQNKD